MKLKETTIERSTLQVYQRLITCDRTLKHFALRHASKQSLALQNQPHYTNSVSVSYSIITGIHKHIPSLCLEIHTYHVAIIIYALTNINNEYKNLSQRNKKINGGPIEKTL